LDKRTAGAGGWRVIHERGRAADLHAVSADALNQPGGARVVRFCAPTAPALVLGSHQPESFFDPAAMEKAGVELARRRSGGSAVLVGPGRVLWVDFVVERADPLWDDDVGRAAWWVGDLWAGALGSGQVWKGPMRATEWSRVVCFAGVGPGEVTVEGRKVVGVCQRRTARAALFQTAALLEWRPEEYRSLMRPSPLDPAGLADAACGLGAAREEAIKAALLARLVT
jgi:lipoate-protein ligase A